jgi:hypothetical protein
MNLYRIGNKVLNLDRLSSILDAEGPNGPAATADGPCLRLLFDQVEVDLIGSEAEAFRSWYRHAAFNLTPHKDEDGEDLMPPADQVREALESLVAQIERARPGDAAMRRAAHRARDVVALYITGELRPAPARAFKASLTERGTT